MKKRGLPEGYVRGLEKLWALALCNIDGFEDTLLAMLEATAESAGHSEKLISVWTNDSASETLQESWKTSRLFAALEKLLYNADASTAPVTGKQSLNPDYDLEYQWEFQVARDSTPTDSGAPCVAKRPSNLSPDVQRDHMSQGSDCQGFAQPASNLYTMQLPDQMARLLDIYFADIHLWFPIVSKHNILRASYLYANTPFSIATALPGSGDYAALWAIFSYTITQSLAKPQAEVVGAISLAKEYYAVSRNLIPSEKEHYELGHIQALLLLTLVNMGLEDWTAAWLLSDQAVRMAVAMGLGTLSDTRQADELIQGKTVFLACFFIDSLLSFRLSRIPSMHPSDLAAVGLLEEDELEGHAWMGGLPLTSNAQGKIPLHRTQMSPLSCFNRLVELASFLNKISQNVWTVSRSTALAQRLLMDLEQWADCLPLECRLIGSERINPDLHTPLCPYQSYLSLTYVATLLWLHLRLVPAEHGLHSLQRPAMEGAKILLYRSLSMISEQLENFPMCDLPPMFEVILRTVVEQAFALSHTVEPLDVFPFGWWANEFRPKMVALSPTWPVYNSLASAMERWQQAQVLPGSLLSNFPWPY